MYANVLILNQDSNHDQILTYLLPPGLDLEVGQLVIVPVRKTRKKGMVLDILSDPPVLMEFRYIEKTVENYPLLRRESLSLAKWLSDYYVCSLNKALQLFLPPPLRMVPKYVLVTGDRAADPQIFPNRLEGKILKTVQEAKVPLTVKQIRVKFGSEAEETIYQLLKRKVLKEKVLFQSQVKESRVMVVSASPEAPQPELIIKKAPRQGAILALLEAGPCTKEALKKKLGNIEGPLKALLEKGWVQADWKGTRRTPFAVTLKAERPARLNPGQKRAVEEVSAAIRRKNFHKLLLYGVTGSGKTEVYLQAIEETLAQGRQALFLVPEISLTPQITALLLEEFGEGTALLHSALSLGERYDEWMRISSGEARVIVGPRSALFAPFTELGLIIIDEEHENTYKQSEPDPRYDARTAAEELARLHQAVLLMGSATPSLKSYLEAEKGHCRLLTLPQRVANRPLPQIEIADMRQELRDGNRGIFSRKLVSSLEETFARGEQAILFMNRRGYHTFVLCRECGNTLNCPNCSISLTYHQARNRLVCHYCNYSRVLPGNCPVCGSRYIRYFGSGTERVVRELENLFPQIRSLRMDRDTTRQKGSHTAILKEFQEGNAQVLIGTQMIAKGLDFPEVTLVGIVNSDTLLNMPDYQASERTYQLITQVAGRAGRGPSPGKVVIQTYSPEHYLFESITRQNYHEFFLREKANRELLQYPPYQSLARVLVSGLQEKKVRERVDYLGELLKIEIGKKGCPVEVLGPSEAPLHFLKGRYRHHLSLKGPDLDDIRELCRLIRSESLRLSPEPRIIIDIEPQSLL